VTVDWTHFTPWQSLAGGVLIGGASALFILASGRLLGISGIVGGLLGPRRGDAGWRLSFLAGLLVAPALWALAGHVPVLRIQASGAALVFAGLLVGWGTRCGSGCTSGHGVCGVSRLSPRSLVATLCFVAAGFGTVFVTRHLLA